MILGIGSDLIDIRRLEKAMARHGERFIKRIFTEVEQQRAQGRRGRISSYAKCFAAKEACSKALGCGIAEGVFWRDIGVVNLPSGKPTIELTGGAVRRISEVLSAGYRAVVHLTITDDFPLAQAFVIIEAVPVERPTLS